MSFLLPEVEAALRAVISSEVTRALEAHLPEPANEGWLSVKSAAAYLDLTEDAVRAMIKPGRGQLMSYRTPQGRVRFRPSDLDAYVLSGGVNG